MDLHEEYLKYFCGDVPEEHEGTDDEVDENDAEEDDEDEGDEPDSDEVVE